MIWEYKTPKSRTSKYLISLTGILLSLVVANFCFPESASGKLPRKISRDKAFPSVLDLYPASDPWRDLKIATEQQMGLYLVEPPRRHASEVTSFSSQHLHFHLWRPISEPVRSLWSRALKWLLFGRIKYSGGARQLFEELPDLKRITLSLHEVERPDERGRRRSPKPDIIHTYLTISLKRSDFERLDIELARSCTLNLDCGETMESQITLLKFNSRYIKRRLR